MLLSQKFAGYGKFGAEDEISQGVFMENVVGKEGVAQLFKINAKLTRPHSIIGLASPMEATQILVRVIELLLGQSAHHFDQDHLRSGVELIELAHTLLAEIDLEHVWMLLRVVKS